jgi:hypothetical protein
MALDKPARRLPLRDLMTDAEKRSRDIVEHFNAAWLLRISDLRDLSRPVRRKSHYPTFQALLNSLNKLLASHEEAEEMIAYLSQQLDEIREHTRRERLARG